MLNLDLKRQFEAKILPFVRQPAQYVGGELNMVRKDLSQVDGRLCLAFPDTYALGMSHHGFQVLYSLMNGIDRWYCERVFTPWDDMEQQLRTKSLPLCSLETFTPLSEFDVVGFSLQYEVCSTNLLTMLDLGGIPLRAEDRTLADPLILAGGPCAQNPEPMAKFIDAFVTGDGEPSLPEICQNWLKFRQQLIDSEGLADGEAGQRQRAEVLAQLAASVTYCYVPRFYEPEYNDGRFIGFRVTRDDVPDTIQPSVITSLEDIPLPTKPIVPYAECVHDRIAVEIMRGCPWQCRFCQSTVIKRPLRIRSVDTIVSAALESYRNTGLNEISILSLSSSDYPHFEPLVRKLKETFGPLGVSISVPSLRINEQLRSIAELIGNERRSSLTLAPEVARDDMREQIRKKIKNEDLFEGCREAFRRNYESVKLYFMCGLPGERPVDLDGIIEMAETISRIGKEVRGRFAKVTASVSNFVPKAHTAYQWNAMQTRDYFHWAHRYLRSRVSLRSVQIKCHDVETSLLEGVLSRGDRRVGDAIEIAWRNGARLDSWREHFDAQRWWDALQEAGIDAEATIHRPYELTDRLPWDHVNIKYGRAFLEKEQVRADIQLRTMANAT
ncbi:MAG: TIGR03960 family B12-binding radical SAM protein [Planctomycetales bacterium]|nr:TIGR03960 family B12-binding radical SAM protein [Planctomycetales bacterium]